MKYLITYGSIQKKVKAKCPNEAANKFAIEMGYEDKNHLLWNDKSGYKIKKL